MRYNAAMYNKLFTKILDSSIWLEDDSTRLIWLTVLAVMDQDGFAQFASVANLAHRARVPLEAAQKAVERLEGPDLDSSDPDNGGRRIERIGGGWLVLNAEKYREIVTRAVAREKTRERVKKHRAGNAPVTPSNTSVTPSDADATADGDHTQTDLQTETQRQTSAPPLILSPLAYERRKAQCAFVGARLEVPHGLHGQLRKNLGGADPDAVLQTWYAELDAEIETSGEAIIPNVFKWLEARFAAWASSEHDSMPAFLARIAKLESERGR